MADNLTTEDGVIATDDVASVHYQRVKLALGADGAAGDAPIGGGVESGSLRVTIANDSTGVLSVDDNGASLTVDNAHLTSLGGAIAGTEVQVDVVGALPAGTNAIGKLAANSGVDIGDVDVTSVPADPFGVNADAASASGSISAKLRQIATNGIPITGTVTVGAHAVTNAGTFAVQDSQKVADNAAFTDGTTPVAPAGYIFDEVAGTSLTENDAAAARIDAKRAQVLVLEDETTRGRRLTITAANAAKVDGSGVTQPVSLASVPSHAVTNAGTFAVQAASAGDTAHDAADSGNPVKIGGKARTTNPTAAADGDRVDATFDDIGRQVVALGHVRDLMTHQHTQIASSSSETTILSAGAAGVFHDVTQIVLTNQTATAVNVTIKDATAGTTRMIIALAASGGASLSFPRPVNQASAANNWTATLSSAAVTVNIFVQAEKNV